MRAPLSVDDVLARAHGQKEQATGNCQKDSFSGQTQNLCDLEPPPRHVLDRCPSGTVEIPFADAMRVPKSPFLVAQIESALDAVSSDDRELWIKNAHALKTLDVDGGGEGKQLWLRWSEKSAKYDPEDAERVWDSISPHFSPALPTSAETRA